MLPQAESIIVDKKCASCPGKEGRHCSAPRSEKIRSLFFMECSHVRLIMKPRARFSFNFPHNVVQPKGGFTLCRLTKLILKDR